MSLSCFNTFRELSCSLLLCIMVSPRFSTQLTTIRPQKKYHCDCSRYCKSQQMEVHHSTYQRHASICQADLEKRLAHYRRDDSSISMEPLLEEGGTNGAYGTQGSQINARGIGEQQVRHAAL